MATGTTPTITFSSPTLTGPSSAGSTAPLSYTSSGGANRGYDSTGYVYTMNRLLDSIAINGKATNSDGFQSGLYAITATATCAQ